MAHKDFITQLHTKTKRGYLERVVKYDKAECATVAKRFDKDYWDGDRRFGYGGHYYDGRWKPIAEAIIDHYKLGSSSRVLDVGCGKGFLLHEIKALIPDLETRGLEISKYALENSKQDVTRYLDHGTACKLPYPDKHFDLVLSINTLHCCYINELKEALREIERVKRGNSYIVVESYRNEKEKTNLLNWQLTCESFFTPDEWVWLFDEFGYTGDYSFVFFE